MKISARSGLLAGLAMLCASLVPAQSFTFGAAALQGTPGTTLQVPVYLTGVTPAVAGANFTVRISKAQDANFPISTATGTLAPGLSTFVYSDNRLANRTGVANGVIQGNVAEYRGVIYSTSNPPATFPASSDTLLATLNVAIPANAAAGDVTIELVSAIDTSTGLLGISDASGNSIVPGAGNPSTTRPNGTTKTVTILPPGDLPKVTDFAPEGSATDWAFHKFPQAGLGDPIGDRVVGQGLRITTTADGSFGFWNPASIYCHPPADSIVIADWTVRSTDGTQQGKVPARLGLQTGDFFYAVDNLYAGLDNNSPDLTPNPEIVYTQSAYVPAQAANNLPADSDGIAVRYDALQFLGPIARPSSITLNHLAVRLVTIGSLTGESTVYTRTFSGNDHTGWSGSGTLNGDGSYTNTIFPGGTSATLVANNGLGVKSDGNGDNTPGVAGDFALGFWQTDSGLLGNADTSKIYRVDYTISGSATTAIRNPPTRLRLFTEDNKFSSVVTIGTDSGDADGAPDAAGKSYVAFFIVPNGENGRPIRIAFDMYDASVGFDSGNPTYNEPANEVLKSITVRTYNKP